MFGALRVQLCFVVGVWLTCGLAPAEDVVSVGNGSWSEPSTWNPPGQPSAGDRVVVTAGTEVLYDTVSEEVIESLQVAGQLRFATDRDTVLRVGNIIVGPRQSAEAGPGVQDPGHHDHAVAHHDVSQGGEARFEIGRLDAPLPAAVSARIVLHFLEGMDADLSPAIVARPGGRIELHGAPMNRTWVKLGSSCEPGDDRIRLGEPVTGWRVGDSVIVTGGPRDERRDTFTEERKIAAIVGGVVELDRPLELIHWGEGEFRSEIANLSRNVSIESADPAGDRGHTMFHRGSSGSWSYVRLAHLGKAGRLGRYPVHFHLVGDSMRGSTLTGLAIVDSDNRWVTLHGTDYVVVRDCVGYRSRGHGFFLEDATEVYNVLDRNLAVGATKARPLPDQALPFDPNDGAGFWWANGKNTFIRNVSTENEEYGYRYDCQQTREFSITLPVRSADGEEREIDVRRLPIWRFEDNEAHTEGFYGMVVAANGNSQPDSPISDEEMLERIRSIDWTGPDARHPHVIRNLSVWQAHYAFRPHSPNMLMENVRLDHAAYGIYRPAFENHVYRNLHISHIGAEPFNRGMDDASAQTGKVTVDGLLFEAGYGNGSTPLIQISDNNLSGDAETHIRNVVVKSPAEFAGRWPLFNRGVGPRVGPLTPGVPIYVHNHFGQGRHAKVASAAAADLLEDGHVYGEDPPFTGDEARVAEVESVDWPELLSGTDDEPPATAITWPSEGSEVMVGEGRLTVCGGSTDNGTTSRVMVNGVPAQDLDYNYHQWEITLTDIEPGPLLLEAWAEDSAGNRELTPHRVTVKVRTDG